VLFPKNFSGILFSLLHHGVIRLRNTEGTWNCLHHIKSLRSIWELFINYGSSTSLCRSGIPWPHAQSRSVCTAGGVCICFSFLLLLRFFFFTLNMSISSYESCIVVFQSVYIHFCVYLIFREFIPEFRLSSRSPRVNPIVYSEWNRERGIRVIVWVFWISCVYADMLYYLK